MAESVEGGCSSFIDVDGNSGGMYGMLELSVLGEADLEFQNWRAQFPPRVLPGLQKFRDANVLLHMREWYDFDSGANHSSF